MSKCVFKGCEKQARKHGPECRTHYMRNYMRKYRSINEDEPRKPFLLSLDVNHYEVDRKAYNDWVNAQ